MDRIPNLNTSLPIIMTEHALFIDLCSDTDSEKKETKIRRKKEKRSRTHCIQIVWTKLCPQIRNVEQMSCFKSWMFEQSLALTPKCLKFFVSHPHPQLQIISDGLEPKFLNNKSCFALKILVQNCFYETWKQNAGNVLLNIQNVSTKVLLQPKFSTIVFLCI